MNVTEPIRKIISLQLQVPSADLRPDVHFRMLPNIDSMRILQIVLETENAFGIEIPDSVTFQVQTLGEYEDLVAGLVGEAAST